MHAAPLGRCSAADAARLGPPRHLLILLLLVCAPQVAGEEPGGASDFDCELNKHNWTKSWTKEKKFHCCQNARYRPSGCGVWLAVQSYKAASGLPTGSAGAATETATTATTTTATAPAAGGAAAPERGVVEVVCWEGIFLWWHVSLNKTVEQGDALCEIRNGTRSNSCLSPASGRIIGKANITGGERAARDTVLVTIRRDLFLCQGSWFDWSQEERDWCCTHRNKSCTTDIGGNENDSFDCSKDEDRGTWSEGQKAWCCLHKLVGCSPGQASSASSSTPKPMAESTTTSTSADSSSAESAGALFACNESQPGAAENWPKEQRDWCCSKEHKGCIEEASEDADGGDSSPPSDTGSDAGSDAGDSAPPSDWHPNYQVRRAEQDLTTTKFDCQADFENWKTLWTEEKKLWCCRNRPAHGCPPDLYFQYYDCKAAAGSGEAAWSEAKKAWCCKSFHIGCGGSTAKRANCSEADCSTSPAQDAFDCTHMDGKEPWSPDRATWCCKERSVGCPEPSGSGAGKSSPFDCEAGFANWERGWSSSKKTWCCEFTKKGCLPELASAPFDCEVSAANPVARWANVKRIWCCEFHKVACSAEAHYPEAKYPAEAGVGAAAAAETFIGRLPAQASGRTVALWLGVAFLSIGICFARSFTRSRNVVAARQAYARVAEEPLVGCEEAGGAAAGRRARRCAGDYSSDSEGEEKVPLVF